MGSPRDYGQNASGLRQWPVPGFTKHLIFYTVTETEITILRVLHGAQDIEAIFNPPNA